MIKCLLPFLLFFSIAYPEDKTLVYTAEDFHGNTLQAIAHDSCYDFYGYGFVSIGLPVFFPSFGCGIRNIENYNALDLSCEISTIILASKCQANVRYLRYLSEEFYFGLGLGFGVGKTLYHSSSCFVNPLFSVGRDGTSTFHEFTLSIYEFDKFYIPGIVYRYGIKF
jgi:hypothetical protein